MIHIKFLALLLFSALTLSACSHNTKSPISTPTSSPAASTTVTQIDIKEFAFFPNTLTVKPGTSVEICNRDLASHTFTSDDNVSFDSGLIDNNECFTLKAPTSPGTYAFHCTPHPSMKGTLFVE